MQGKSKIYQRRSIRLKNYDYSKAGLYFITICTWNNLHLFGKIENDLMIINKNGEIAEKEWFKTGELRSNIKLHEFIIMPNHLHGIIEIINRHDTTCRGTACRAQFAKPISNTIPTIIRNEESYLKISEYIVSNTLKWRENKYYG